MTNGTFSGSMSAQDVVGEAPELLDSFQNEKHSSIEIQVSSEKVKPIGPRSEQKPDMVGILLLRIATSHG